MKLAAFKIKGQARIGILSTEFENKIFDISDFADDIVELIEKTENVRQNLENLDEQIVRGKSLKKDLIGLENVSLLPPIKRPGKIICLAGNYRKHITESGYIEPKQDANFTQQLFLKPSTSLIGDGEVIELGRQNVKVGWETELAVIIGKRGKNITIENASEHIFGYTILNDISERGLNSRIENRHLREMDGFCDWLAGKWFDGFAPCGPWIVTKDEINDPHDLEIKFYLNGEMWQNGNTSEMIFDIPRQIAYCSSIMTLEPGDIISTGTPAGAGLGEKETTLADGDELISEIEGLGKLKNYVRWTN